jgi:hypothetical protein
MKYTKPELVVLGSPIKAVLSGTQKPDASSDSHGCNEPATATAYEADE